MRKVRFLLMLLFTLMANPLMAFAEETAAATETTNVSASDLEQIKQILTDKNVVDLFKNGSSFSILVYTVLAVLLIVVVLFGGITIYSMLNSAKASKAFAEAMKDTREFAENFAAYKESLNTNFDSLHDSVTRLSTQTSRDFRAVFDRMAAFEKSISTMDTNLSTMYTYCVASEQVKQKRRESSP